MSGQNRRPVVTKATYGPAVQDKVAMVFFKNFVYLKLSVSQFTWHIWQTNNSIKSKKPNRIMKKAQKLCLGQKKSFSSPRLELTAQAKHTKVCYQSSELSVILLSYLSTPDVWYVNLPKLCTEDAVPNQIWN